MSARLCLCGELLISCPHLGTFPSLDAKRACLANFAEMRTKLEAFIISAEAKKIASLARSMGAGRYLPDFVKEAAKHVCMVAPYAEFLPEDKRLHFVKLAASVASAVCALVGE